MSNPRRAYEIVITCCALTVGWALYAIEPAIPTEGLEALFFLCVLAFVAEVLALLMPNTIYGSVAFVPYLSAVLIVPHWITVVGVAAVRLVLEVCARRVLHKAIFNIAQQSLAVACAVLVFKFTAGESMYALSGYSLSQITIINGLPTLAAFVVSFAVNTSLVAGHVSVSTARPFGEVWRGTNLSTIGTDVLASPIVFLFGWVYVNWGAFAAAALWIPILGIRQLHRTNLALERHNSELLELMVKSLEARDPYTSGHSRRVQQYSVAIARGIGLGPATIDQVSRAALLHDVGKIHEKYAPVLRKAGTLSGEEWQIIQQHPADGAELVSTMSRLHDIVPAIRHHHERWNGTGYPMGLAGETIPLVSRIIAFADTIDAMTSERPYRTTLSEEEVRAEIVRCRGTQFDPTMTDKVLSASTWRLIFPASAPKGLVPQLSLVPRERVAASQ